MLFVTHWTCSPENLKAVVARFKKTGGPPPKGVKMIGRGHDVTQRRSIIVSEAADASAIASWSYQWSDLLQFETYPSWTMRVQPRCASAERRKPERGPRGAALPGGWIVGPATGGGGLAPDDQLELGRRFDLPRSADCREGPVRHRSRQESLTVGVEPVR